MSEEEYLEFVSITKSWWFSLPNGLQKELKEFYESINKLE